MWYFDSMLIMIFQCILPGLWNLTCFFHTHHFYSIFLIWHWNFQKWLMVKMHFELTHFTAKTIVLKTVLKLILIKTLKRQYLIQLQHTIYKYGSRTNRCWVKKSITYEKQKNRLSRLLIYIWQRRHINTIYLPQVGHCRWCNVHYTNMLSKSHLYYICRPDYLIVNNR